MRFFCILYLVIKFLFWFFFFVFFLSFISIVSTILFFIHGANCSLFMFICLSLNFNHVFSPFFFLLCVLWLLAWRINSLLLSPKLLSLFLCLCLFCFFFIFSFSHNCIALALVFIIGHDLFGLDTCCVLSFSSDLNSVFVRMCLGLCLCVHVFFWAWLFATDPSLFLFNIGFGFYGPCVAFFCWQMNCANNNMIELLSFLATRRAKAAKKTDNKKSTKLSKRCVWATK